MILTAATWNLLGGGIDNGSDARLRRQLTLLADLNLDVAALQFSDHRPQQDASELVFSVADMSVTFTGRRRNAWAIARWRYPSCPLWGLLPRTGLLPDSTLLIRRTSSLPPLPGTA